MEGPDAECLLDDPALRLGREPLVGRVALDVLHVNARSGAVRDDGTLEPLVHQHRPDGRSTGGDLVQQGGPGCVLVRRRRQDHDRDDQPQDVRR